jgi:hypothetical protein
MRKNSCGRKDVRAHSAAFDPIERLVRKTGQGIAFCLDAILDLPNSTRRQFPAGTGGDQWRRRFGFVNKK